MPAQDQSFDFIVVGSGASGGVLASRLVRNDQGLKVLLIDAGSDPRANKHYQVPAFHALVTEDPELRWDYFVEHFSDPAQHQRLPAQWRDRIHLWHQRPSGVWR